MAIYTDTWSAAQIEKLSILGIRSFSNRGNGEKIDFHTPLTLIVGYNGSGKTTIIECLKYATTGQFPPNSKNGAAFVHDPKLTGEKEVYAQVKLQFKSVGGHKMVLTRSMQVTVKKGANPSFKTLDSQLLMYKDGERTTMSTKVADLDKVMPQYIGVSQAVLDNVIFCHQDESLWPMSEPAALKKKFDEIFEALKYTSAMKDIVGLQKKQKIELDKYLLEEKHQKENKDRGERAAKKSKALDAQIDELKAQAATLEQDLNNALQAKKELEKQASRAAGIVEELKAKTQRAQNLQENIDNLKPNLEELQESDEWLQSTLEQYEDRMRQYREQNDDLQSQYKELQEELSASRQQLSTKQAEKGRYQAQKESYERQIQHRRELVQEAARRHSLRGYEGDLDESQIQEFIGRVQKLSRDKNQELDRTKKATEDELDQTQKLITQLDNRKSVRTRDKAIARRIIAENEKKLAGKQREADAIRMDEGAKAALEISLVDSQARIQRLNEEYETADWDNNLNSENIRLRELEAEREGLDSEFAQSNKLAKDRAQLDWVQKEAKRTQGQLDVVKVAHSDKLCSLLGSDWEWNNLQHEFQAVLDQKNQGVADAKNIQEGISRELRELDFKLKSARASLTRKKEQTQKCQAVVLNSITTDEGKPLTNPDDYLGELNILEGEYNKTQQDLDGVIYVAEYYTRCRNTADHQSTCRLCERPFLDKKERSLALQKIDRELAKLTQEALKKELANLKQELSTATAARSEYEMYKTFCTEISSIETEIRELENKKTPLVRRLETQDNTVLQEEEARRDVAGLESTVKTIADYISAISTYEADISALSSQQKASGSSSSLEEIEKKSASCNERLRAIKTNINKITNERDQARSMKNSLDIELSSISNKLANASHQLEKKQNLLSDISDLRNANIQQRDTIQGADAELESLVPEFAKANAQNEDVRKRGRAKEKEIQADKDRLADTVNKFKLVEEDINRYVLEGGPEHLAACQRAIKALEQDQMRIDSEVVKTTKEANELKKRVDDSERTRRSIIDNLQFRKNLRALDDAKKDIAELESRNATDDYDQLWREHKKADSRWQKLSLEKNSVLTSLKHKCDELEEHYELYEIDFKEAAQNFRKAHIKVETTKAAIDDLGKYSKALDAAIMKFHSVKMEEINRIAGELWQQTYQGTDVDTIMIRSENENKSSKSSYNYRVVMVKSDAEMDMRGRCSAGQKVLASIIIRLALAECFGVNCGIIALDEPTTNLDNDNIKALAKSLHMIIKARRQQANFQLIVITHDEAFLKEMKCQEFCENFFRVGRNEKQTSTIDIQPISDLMGT